MLECGIDEAGRGPVIGPLVIAGVLLDEKQASKLQELGVKDSKLISKARMQYYADEIKKSVTAYEILIIQPDEIDKALYDPHLNLNWLEAIKAAEIVNILEPQKLVLDCPSTNPQAFEEYITKLFKKQPAKIICEHKADLKHLSAGAASILAKAKREEEVANLKQKIGIDFGSGYPSDPKTIAFTKKYHDKFPELFRKSWQSYKNAVEKNKQKGLGEF